MIPNNNFDINEFFKEATLRICSQLEIEKALFNFFSYIYNIIPADQITLNILDRPEKAAWVYATASHEGGARTEMRIPIPPSEQWMLSDIKRYPKKHIANTPESGVFTKQYLDGLGFPNSSLLSIMLSLEGEPVGLLAIRAGGKNRFKQADLDKIWLLNEPMAIALVNSRRYLELVSLKETLTDDNDYLQQELSLTVSNTIIGKKGDLRIACGLAQQVSPTNFPVMLRGETGVGKEVFARAIHKWSLRHNKPFIKVNCGAIPATLIDSELFGYEEGAFTGATRTKRGRFERANNGTILLDEVGELSLEAQVRLLRVLEEKQFERVGGGDPVAADSRVIAATHRNLEKMVAKGSFRRDLFYRLNVFPILIPPLRDRKNDFEFLLQYFIKKGCAEIGRNPVPSPSQYAVERLRAYDWPGNVRELEHIVKRTLIIDQNSILNFAEFAPKTAPLILTDPSVLIDEDLKLDEAIARQIYLAMDKAKGRVEGINGAAKLLDIKPGKLRYQMKRLGIPFGHKHAFR
ncbi:MAG: sigma 54-interacting transcriptional regulator [Deltaproteobacteria bacterium]|nr:sigma 54-interacting transcriptional regulator [Deltaproteobacteria bacterium]